jgi:hypothetical protein
MDHWPMPLAARNGKSSNLNFIKNSQGKNNGEPCTEISDPVLPKERQLAPQRPLPQ